MNKRGLEINLGTDPLSSSQHNCWAVSNSCLGAPELPPSETNSRKKSAPRTDPYRKYGEHTSFGFIQLAQLFTKLLQALHPQPTSYRTPGHSFSTQPDFHTKNLSLHKNVHRDFPNPRLTPGLCISNSYHLEDILLLCRTWRHLRVREAPLWKRDSLMKNGTTGQLQLQSQKSKLIV